MASEITYNAPNSSENKSICFGMLPRRRRFVSPFPPKSHLRPRVLTALASGQAASLLLLVDSFDHPTSYLFGEHLFTWPEFLF